MKLKITSTGVTYDYPRAIGEALLATGVVEEVRPEAPRPGTPSTLWSVQNAVISDNGDVQPPAIVARCGTCGSWAHLTGKTAAQTQKFRHNNPAPSQEGRPPVIGCAGEESVPQRIADLYAQQLRRIPRPREQKSRLEELRSLDKFAVRAI